MKLTDSATEAIVSVMEKKGLNPEEWFMEFRILENGAIGIGFTQKRLGQIINFGRLQLTIEEVIDTEGVLIDYGEHKGRYGLFFMGEPVSPDPRPKCGNPDCTCEANCNGDGSGCGGECACASAASG